MHGPVLGEIPRSTRLLQDSNRRGDFPTISFTFLGYTFRHAKHNESQTIHAFLPAISKEALKKISRQVRAWRLHKRTGHTAAEIAQDINPIVRGWMTYYGVYYKARLYPLLQRINTYLYRWMMKKYKDYQTWKQAYKAMRRKFASNPKFFAHWPWVEPTVG
jgi:hypothetical protein